MPILESLLAEHDLLHRVEPVSLSLMTPCFGVVSGARCSRTGAKTSFLWGVSPAAARRRSPMVRSRIGASVGPVTCELVSGIDRFLQFGR